MNSYGTPYNPDYARSTGYAPAMQQGPQYPLAALSNAHTGQLRNVTAAEQAILDKAAADKIAADKAANPNPAITSPEWWKQTTFDVPRWALAGGAASLGLIAYLWSTGMFGGKSMSTSVRRTRTSGDFSLDRRRARRRRTSASTKRRRASTSTKRSHRRSTRRRDATGTTSLARRGNGASRAGRNYGFDLDFNL